MAKADQMFGLGSGMGLGGARPARMTVGVSKGVDAAEFGASKATIVRKKGATIAKRKLDFSDSDEDEPKVKKFIPPKRVTAPAVL